MNENNQVNNTIAMQEATQTTIEPTKPYVFRKLNASDIPTMLRILKKIEINKFANCFKNETLIELMSNEKENTNFYTGGAIFLEVAQILISGVADCGDDIFKLLADTSNLSFEEVKALEFDVFAEMIIDFIKKDEFVGFFKAVSRLLNMEK